MAIINDGDAKRARNNVLKINSLSIIIITFNLYRGFVMITQNALKIPEIKLVVKLVLDHLLKKSIFLAGSGICKRLVCL